MMDFVYEGLAFPTYEFIRRQLISLSSGGASLSSGGDQRKKYELPTNKLMQSGI